MRFLIDECTGPVVAHWLREQNHDVFSLYEQSRGIDDETVVRKAFDENRILITNDKDFGEKVYREGWPHKGIVLLRLNDERAANKIKVLHELLVNYPDQLTDRYLVVTDTVVRFAKNPE
jgi:predicted nuclease of predicted toxin-antitoxin system